VGTGASCDCRLQMFNFKRIEASINLLLLSAYKHLIGPPYLECLGTVKIVSGKIMDCTGLHRYVVNITIVSLLNCLWGQETDKW